MNDEISVRNKRSRGRGRYGESRLAKLVGGITVGRSKAVRLPSGKWIAIDCQHPPDVVTDVFSYENKHLASLPVKLETAMTQAMTNAPKGLIPVLHLTNRKTRVSYFVVTEKDWLALHVGTIISQETSKSDRVKGNANAQHRTKRR